MIAYKYLLEAQLHAEIEFLRLEDEDDGTNRQKISALHQVALRQEYHSLKSTTS
jgi:hypothetical protein